MSSESPFPIPTLQDANIIVCGLIGIVLSFYLAGVACCQFFLAYQLLFPSSRSDVKERENAARLRGTLKWRLCGGAIGVLFVLCMVDTALKVAVAVVYVRQALLLGTPGIYDLPNVALGVTAIEGVTALFVQGIYIARLWVVWPSHKVLFFSTAGLLFLALAGLQAGASIYMGYKVDRENIPGWSNLKLCAGLWWGAASLNDVLLCLAFIYSLSTFATGTVEGNWLITRWVVFSLETGLVSTLLQIATLFLFLYGWRRAWFFASLLPLTDVYINSVLVVFRVMLSGGLKGKSGHTTSIGSHSSHGHKTPGQGSQTHFSAFGSVGPTASTRFSMQQARQHRWQPTSEFKLSTSFSKEEPFSNAFELEIGSPRTPSGYRRQRQFEDSNVSTAAPTPARSIFETEKDDHFVDAL